MAAKSGDEGETLLEIVLAVLFIGLVVVSLVGALGTAASLGDNHRDVTTADVELKAAMEAVKSAPYVAGAGATASYGTVAAAAPGASGYSRSVAAVRCVPLTAAASFAVTAATDCSTDSGLQVVTVSVTSALDGVGESTTVLKRRP